jgi:uncharacterized repeat protein (TIGR01451 family)
MIGRRFPCRRHGRRVLAVLIGLLAGALLVLIPGISSAVTPYGTHITNLVSLEFRSNPGTATIPSNQTDVTADGFNEVSIGPPWSGSAYPGTAVDILHTVTNGGNMADTFDLEGTSSLGLPLQILASDGQTPLADSNGNGIPDVGPIPPGGTIDIVLRITVPMGTSTGQVDNTTILATSATTPTVQGSVTNLATIPNFWDPLEKSVDPTGQVSPGVTVTYTNTFGNSGGVPATNAVIADVLDANLIYIDGSATSPPGISGTVIAYDPATRTLTWTIPVVPAGYTGQVRFRAIIDPNALSDSTVSNRISMVSDQSPAPQISNIVSNVVVEQPLRITKSADRDVAEIGDYVVYTVRVENTSASLAADNVIVSDDLPQGFRYVKGTSVLEGAGISDPAGGTRPQWPIGALPFGTSKTLVYRAIISIDAMLGDGTNSARTTGDSPGGNRLLAGPAKVRVKVEEGVLNSKTIILGRVFIDRNGDKVPDENEPGVKDVRLYLEDGTYVITDAEGKFSIYNVRAGEHVLKLDRNSLPPGYVPVPLNNTFAGDGGSQFLSVPFGGPARGDFGLVPVSGAQTLPAESKEKGAERVYTFGTTKAAPPPPLEVQVQHMDPTPEILSPAGGATLGKPWTHIAVRVPEEARHVLKVNGVVIPQKRIGKKIHESARKLFVYEYVGVKLSPGPNTIALESIGPGEERVEKKIAVTAPGPPVKIVLDPPKATVVADGISTIPFTVTLLDEWNRPSMEDAVITVVSTRGTIVEEDLDPSSAGHQMRLKGGRSNFSLRSSQETGSDRIKVSLGNDMEAEGEVFFTPELRDWVVAGIGAVTVGGKSVSGDTDRIRDKDEFEEGLFHEEKLALFAKGKIFDKYLLTGAYDTDKPKGEGLFQRSAPERFYPIYGDASTIGYDAESQRKLYLKVERDRSSIMFGDYHTGLSDNEFGRYDRTFNGLKADIDTGGLTFRGFAAETDQVMVKDEIPGNGTSGFYFLSRTPVIENSETIRIEVRDRFHPEKVLSSVEKVPFTDYDIDYTGGTLLFKEPVPSLDGGFNPVRIIVLYEASGAGAERYTYGGRAGVRLGGKLEFGATAIVEEKGIQDDTLFGADAALALSEKFQLKGEIAASDTLDEGTGSAWKVELASDVGRKLAFRAYYRDVEESFRNLSMTGSEEGTTKYGANATYRLREKTSITAESFVQEDKLNGSKQFVNSLGVKRNLSRATVEAGYRYLNEDRSAPGQQDRSSQIAHAGVSGNITDKLGGALKREQVLTSDEVTDYPSKTTAELTYQISETLRAHLAQEIQEGEQKREATVLGLESKVTESTTLSSRYQIENTISGDRAQAVLGLNNKWEPKKGITLNTKAERIQNVDGNDDDAEGTSLAVSAEYLRSENVKATGRYEVRLGDLETTNLFSLGAAVKVADGLSLLPKMELWLSDKDQGTDSLFDGFVGVAYRPKGKPSFYLLDSLRFRFERVRGAGTTNEKRSLTSSTEASYRLSPRWTLVGKYAGKYAWESLEGIDFTSYTDLLIAGATYDLTERWDVGVQAKLMNQYDTEMHSVGAVVRTGYRIYKNLVAGVGYNLSRMDDKDLSGANYQSHGPFIELKFKFDEETMNLRSEQTERKTEAPPPLVSRPVDNVVVNTRNLETPVEIRGSVEMLTLLVNGEEIPLPTSDVSMRSKALDDVLEITGDRLGKPVLFLFEAASVGAPKAWNLDIMNAQGQIVRTLSGEGIPPGEIPWDGRTEDGQLVRGGELYQYQMVVGYTDGSRSRSARRIFGVNRTSAISLSLTGSAFDFNSAVLSSRAKESLKQVAEALRKFPGEKVVVEGHTDDIGTDKYNLDLSRKRAEAALDFLVKHGRFPAKRFLVHWYGKSRPIASNETPEGREINRRVEVKGQFHETTKVYVLDQYRTAPSVRINRLPVELDSMGRFVTRMTGATDRIEVEMLSAEGRSVHTRVPLPTLSVLQPTGVAKYPCGSSGETYSVNGPPEGREWKKGEKVMSYRLVGRTEPGNTVELYGKKLAVGSDGTFSGILELREGENIYGLVVQNAEGGTRVMHVEVAVSMERGSLHAGMEGAQRSAASGSKILASTQAKKEIQ